MNDYLLEFIEEWKKSSSNRLKMHNDPRFIKDFLEMTDKSRYEQWIFYGDGYAGGHVSTLVDNSILPRLSFEITLYSGYASIYDTKHNGFRVFEYAILAGSELKQLKFFLKRNLLKFGGLGDE